MEKGFMQNVVVVAALLGIVFLSQQAFLRPQGQKLYTQAASLAQGYWGRGVAWFDATVYPNASAEIQKRGAPLALAVAQQKNNAAQGVWSQIKNYFAAQFSHFSGTKVQ